MVTAAFKASGEGWCSTESHPRWDHRTTEKCVEPIDSNTPPPDVNRVDAALRLEGPAFPNGGYGS